MQLPIPKSAMAIASVTATLCSLLVSLPAGAQQAPESPTPEQAQAPLPPWHKGVSEARKRQAQALFAEGKQLNEQLLLGEAQKKYVAALALWEHPQLRLYLARVQARIGLPLLGHENLVKALAWGPGALDPDEDNEARAALRALEQKELGALAIHCDEPGAAVLLDGKSWFTGKGTERRMLLPGEHIVTARKAGYYTTVKSVAVVAGKEASGAVRLSVDTTLTKRRWAAWMPWTVLGAGAALGGLGGGLLALASSDYDETNQRLAQRCGTTCAPDTTGPYTSTRWENGIGIGSLVVGGAGLVAGSAMVLLNLPQSYRTQDESDVKVEVVPLASPAIAGVSARFSF